MKRKYTKFLSPFFYQCNGSGTTKFCVLKYEIWPFVQKIFGASKYLIIETLRGEAVVEIDISVDRITEITGNGIFGIFRNFVRGCEKIFFCMLQFILETSQNIDIMSIGFTLTPDVIQSTGEKFEVKLTRKIQIKWASFQKKWMLNMDGIIGDGTKNVFRNLQNIQTTCSKRRISRQFTFRHESLFFDVVAITY